MSNFLFPTHATEMLEQTLSNTTIAANTSVKTTQSVGYGVALTGASAIDTFTVIWEKHKKASMKSIRNRFFLNNQFGIKASHCFYRDYSSEVFNYINVDENLFGLVDKITNTLIEIGHVSSSEFLNIFCMKDLFREQPIRTLNEELSDCFMEDS
jgi:hypothetical protein